VFDQELTVAFPDDLFQLLQVLKLLVFREAVSFTVCYDFHCALCFRGRFLKQMCANKI
jgi:hypothetical protein